MRRASVLPCMTHPTSKETYFLLGRNKIVPDWPEGSAVFSDFGGQCKASESIEECAAREFIEESIEALLKLADMPIFVQSLVDEHYILKYETATCTVFVVRFAWKPLCVFEFSNYRAVLNAFYKLCNGYTLSAADIKRMHSLSFFHGKKSNLKTILHHPAIRYTYRTVSKEEADTAVNKLASCLETSAALPKSGAQEAFVIQSVDAKWLEKDSIQLFSLEQLKRMICKQVPDALLQEGFADMLRPILESLCFAGHCDALLVECLA
jgi:hypothetical protein